MKKKPKINYDVVYFWGFINVPIWIAAILDLIYRIVTRNWEPCSFIYAFLALLPVDAVISILLTIFCALLALVAYRHNQLTPPIKKAFAIWGINAALIITYLIIFIVPQLLRSYF